MPRVRSLALVAAFAATTALAGCGEKLMKAGGTVKVDGVPVKEGTIMFVPTKSGRPANGRIMDGAFTLSFNSPDDGLPPGDYKVVIVADIWKEGKKSAEQLREEAAMKKNNVTDELAVPGTLIHVVPPEYNHHDTTPLTQTVPASGGEQKFDFNIMTKKKK
jgi:hypothetical protein